MLCAPGVLTRVRATHSAPARRRDALRRAWHVHVVSVKLLFVAALLAHRHHAPLLPIGLWGGDPTQTWVQTRPHHLLVRAWRRACTRCGRSRLSGGAFATCSHILLPNWVFYSCGATLHVARSLIWILSRSLRCSIRSARARRPLLRCTRRPRSTWVYRSTRLVLTGLGTVNTMSEVCVGMTLRGKP